MKTPLLGISLIATTAAVVALYPMLDSKAGTPPPLTVQLPVPRPDPIIVPTARRPRIEVVFALDTTGSMGGLIAAAKEKIWSVASTMAAGQPAPEIRIGLVAYRDRGDAYVTEVVDLSGDLDSMYAKLMDFRAEGGGDGPEAVNQALADAVRRMQWSTDPDTYKVVFLVGDAPPHGDYQDEAQYPQIVAEARARGIVINTIQCGQDPATRNEWQQIAALGQGEYLPVEQDGAAVAFATPFDGELARLSADMDDTRMYFGDAEIQARQAAKQAATAKLHAAASSASLARRAAFNTTASGTANFLGEQELVSAVATGKVALADIPVATLPAPLQAMAPAAREALVKEKAEQRRDLERRIVTLARKRDAFLEREVAETGGAAASLDHKLFDAVRKQGASVGLEYDTAPKY